MRSDWYTLLSMGMRYWFAAIAAIIVFRAWRATVRDNRRARVLRAWAPDTGAIGEIVVVAGGSGVRKGSRIPVPKEGLLGSSRRSDVRLRHADVRRYHAHIEQRENGVLMETLGKAEIWLGGRTGRKLLLRDGDRFMIGSLSLMLVLYSPGEDTQIDLDLAEDEMFSPAGLGAVKPAPSRQKNVPTEPVSKKVDIFMEDIAPIPTKKQAEKKPAAKKPAAKKRTAKAKKVPSADELFMPFDDGFEPFEKQKQPVKKKNSKKKTEEVLWWQDEKR